MHRHHLPSEAENDASLASLGHSSAASFRLKPVVATAKCNPSFFDNPGHALIHQKNKETSENAAILKFKFAGKIRSAGKGWHCTFVQGCVESLKMRVSRKVHKVTEKAQ